LRFTPYVAPYLGKLRDGCPWTIWHDHTSRRDRLYAPSLFDHTCTCSPPMPSLPCPTPSNASIAPCHTAPCSHLRNQNPNSPVHPQPSRILPNPFRSASYKDARHTKILFQVKKGPLRNVGRARLCRYALQVRDRDKVRVEDVAGKVMVMVLRTVVFSRRMG
jgi:hypothetical protein